MVWNKLILKQPFWRSFLAMMTIVGAAIVYQNCSGIVDETKNKSGLSSYQSYIHTGLEPSCSGCHESFRPRTANGFQNLNPNAPFDYSTHGAGMDCVSCHNIKTINRTWNDWASGYFDHSGNLTSCVGCHSSQRPRSIVNGFNHATTGTTDCISCHANALQTAFSQYPDDWGGAIGAPSELVWNPSKDLNLSTYHPTFAETTMVSVANQNQIVHMAMNHATTQLPAIHLENCNLCHTNASAGVFFPGVFHNSLSAANIAQPNVCVDCHNLSSRPVGFVGPLESSRQPQTPAMKHNAVVWSKNTSSQFVATTTTLVNNDCATCHKNPGGQWTNAAFHNALTNANLAQPSSCLDCHANNRPVGLTTGSGMSTGFDHNWADGKGDCLACHTSQSNWGNGKFHLASGTLTACSSCHESGRPTNTSGWVGLNPSRPFDYLTHGQGLDCVSCHSGTNVFLSKANWSGGHFTHTANLASCLGCHTSQRPTQVVNGFDHATNGKGDCIGCHKSTLTNNVFTSLANWAGGQSQPDGLVGSTAINITAKHLNYTGAKVTSVSNNVQSLPLQMLHSSSAVPTAIANNCVACHANANSGNYAGGKFHASLTTANLPQPNSCKDCHTGTLPKDIVKTSGDTLNLRPMDHAATFVSGQSAMAAYDCVSCHSQVGTSFGGGLFHGKIAANNPTNCTICHYQVMTPTLINKMLHSSNFAVFDCKGCHALPTQTQINNPALANWAGGLFHSAIAIQPTGCIDCHASQKPTVTTVSGIDNQHMNHRSNTVASECAVCHLNDTATNPRIWEKTNSFHSAVPSPTTCKECHGLTNGSTVAGTGNDIPAGLTFSDTKTTSSVAPANTYDQFTHTVSDVAGKDCNLCHTTIGANGPKWKSASFHNKVSPPASRCDSCHMNLKPSVVVAGFDHATISTNDCNMCHVFPGTGAVNSTTNPPNWKGASGAVPATVVYLSPSTVNWVSLTTAHPSTTSQSGMTCATCHLNYNPKASIIGFDHQNRPSGTRCTYCHLSGQQVVASANATGKFSTKGQGHEGANFSATGTDCVPCHNPRYPTYSTTTKKFSGGSW